MKLKQTSASNYTVSLTIKTIHGQFLDFLLMHVEGRTGTDYCIELHNMLDREFKSSNSCGVTSIESYGHVYFDVYADTPTDLQTAMLRADRVIRHWLARFNINQMIDKR